AEFKKIVWPSRPEVVKKTATVIVTSLIVGAIIFCMDTVFNAGYSAIIGLLG
ncbi:MAG: preprotein translocase subunit SecE, partial [Anaerotignum sp.]|nr:preprotein translocase subunit SecE [Anaerotignum sp.]